MTKMNKSLSARDFAEAFGADEGEVSRFCGEIIESLDFKYRVCPQETHEKTFLDGEGSAACVMKDICMSSGR